MRRPSAAFTLIELLVVMLIIGILAGLLVVLAGTVFKRAEDVETSNRLLGVMQNLQQIGTTDGSSAYTLMRDGMGRDFRWGSLREVFGTIIHEHKVDLKATPELVPYGNAMYIDPDLHTKSNGDVLSLKSPPSSFSLDAQVGFSIQIKIWIHDNDRYYGDDLAVQPTHGTKHRQSYPVLGFPVEYSYDRGYIFGKAHDLGETLDNTLEVVPLGPWTRDDYLAAWPPLIETWDPISETVSDLQCWPDSDWTADPIGTVDPIWPWPWGQKIIARTTAEQIEQMLEHDLSELTPLHGRRLLQLAGILPAGSEGEIAFRENRNRQKPWNDRWGNPLLVASAAFIAPRYDYGPTETWRDLKGGRELLVKRAQSAYGAARMVYLAAGAIGERRRDVDDDLDLDGWEGNDVLPGFSLAEEPTVLRLGWRQVTATCTAEEWDETAFADPPWEGVRSEDGPGRSRCFLTAPTEIR